MEHFSEAWKKYNNPPYAQVASGSKSNFLEIITNLNK
jgi:hypothetical protein